MSGFQFEKVIRNGVSLVQVPEICCLHHPDGDTVAMELFRKILTTFIDIQVGNVPKTVPEETRKRDRLLVINHHRGESYDWRGWIQEAAKELKKRNSWKKGGLVEINEIIIRF